MAKRKSRAKQPESPASEPVALAAALDQSPAVAAIQASREAIEPERPMPEPGAEILRQRDREQEQPETTHSHQLGPRKRQPSEPATVYASVQNGFKLLQDGPFRKFKFDEEPPREVKDKLQDAGFHYVPFEKSWSAPASWQIREASDKLAIELDGKDISHGRGV